MPHALTVKGQITIPKAMRDHMGVRHGQRIEFLPQANGNVMMFVANLAEDDDNPFLQFIGTGVSGQTTEQILNETRGIGWNK